ncbi:MAG: hypothetical protein KGZ86_00820 [Candidatus Latescibacteria bacterium]|nr:hypothetical protein [Candidatus Latescibacterota bacterium]
MKQKTQTTEKSASSQQITQPRKKKSVFTAPVIIAVIGLCGTLAAAIVAGVFGLINTRTQIDRPIMFTQTAESISAINPTNTEEPSPTEPSLDWQKIVTVRDRTPSSPALVYPEYLFSGSDVVKWLQENGGQYYYDGELMYSLYIHDGDSYFIFGLEIVNKSGGQDWVRLGNDMTLSVQYIGDAPDVTHVVELPLGSGAGFFREFSEVPLNSAFDRYDAKAVSTDADFYTLEPGEFEIFVVRFVCEHPGVYNVQFNIPITYQGEDGLITYTGANGFVCPDKMTYYLGGVVNAEKDVIISDVKQYEWTGSGYSIYSP